MCTAIEMQYKETYMKDKCFRRSLIIVCLFGFFLHSRFIKPKRDEKIGPQKFRFQKRFTDLLYMYMAGGLVNF